MTEKCQFEDSPVTTCFPDDFKLNTAWNIPYDIFNLFKAVL